MTYLLIFFYVLTTAAGLILLKLGSSTGSIIEFVNNRLAFHFTILNVIGVLLYGLSFLLYTYLISKHDLGYIIPITTALVYIIIFFASFAIFKESFTLLKTIGIALVLIGVALINSRQ